MVGEEQSASMAANHQIKIKSSKGKHRLRPKINPGVPVEVETRRFKSQAHMNDTLFGSAARFRHVEPGVRKDLVDGPVRVLQAQQQ